MPPVVKKVYEGRDLPATFLSSWHTGRKSAALFDGVETYCMFVGYPRSGHSVIGSLLDAHPEAVIGHELDALRYVAAGFGRNQLYSLILDNDKKFTRAGRKAATGAYDYSVPGQWQGRFDKLRVIGDKRGGKSTVRLQAQPGLLDRLSHVVGVRIRVVHVIRNPFDNITTATLRRGPHATLDESIAGYFSRCRLISALRAGRFGKDFLDIRHEAFIEEPEPSLGSLCQFVGLEASESYLRDCASILYKSPNRSRTKFAWSDRLIAEVQGQIDEIDYLKGYSFSS